MAKAVSTTLAAQAVSSADANALQSVLTQVPDAQQHPVQSIISNLISQFGGNAAPVIAWVMAHLPEILALLTGGFSWQAILAFVVNIFTPQPTPPIPVPIPAPV
jgi:hypothetical protein